MNQAFRGFIQKFLWLGVVAATAAWAQDAEAQAGARSRDVRKPLRDVVDKPRVPVPHHAVHEVVLALKVDVDCPLDDSGAGRDLGHRYLVVPLCLKRLSRGFEN